MDRLASMEKRWKKIRFWRAAGITLVLLLVAIAAAAIIDYLIPLNYTQRIILSVLAYGTAVAYAIVGWWIPYRRKLKPQKIAWILEAAVPDFNEKLISAVELKGIKDERLSMDMIQRVLEDAEADLSHVKPERVFPLGWKHFAIPVIVLLAFLAPMLMPQLQFSQMVARVAFPSDRQATVGAYKLNIEQPRPTRLAEGDEAAFTVSCSDNTIKEVDFCIEEDGKIKRFPMAYDEEAGVFTHGIEDLRRSFLYFAQSKRVQSTKYELTVMRRPRVESYTLAYTFPEYTGMPPATEETTSGAIQGYIGTKVALHIEATKPLDTLRLDWLGEPQAVILSPDGRNGELELELTESGDWSLELVDRDGLTNLNSITYSIIALADNEPSVTLDQPAGDVHLSADDSLELGWNTSDDFGVEALDLVYTVTGREHATLALPLDTNGFSWALSDSGLQQGDEVTFHLQVTDAVGQTGKSEARYLSLVQGLQLTQAMAFREHSAALAAELQPMGKRLADIESVATKLREASGGAAAEDREHHLNVMRSHARWISERLDQGEALSGLLKDNGFFPRARVSADLMGRYFRQERLFSTAQLLHDESADQAIEDLGMLRQLNTEMVRELQHKSEQAIPAIQARQMHRTAVALEGSKSSGDLLDRIAARAKRIAETHKKDHAARFDSTNKLASHLSQLQRELDKRSGDVRKLDAIGNKIRERLQSRDEQLSSLARQLALFNRQKDWEAVEAMEAMLRAEADRAEDAQEQSDYRAAADALRKAIEEQEASAVAAVNEALPELQRAAELKALAEEIAAVRAETEELLDELRAKLAEDGELSAEDFAALEETRAKMDELQEATIDGDMLQKEKDTAAVQGELRAAETHLDQAEQAAMKSDEKKAMEAMTNMDQRLANAEQKAELAADQAEQQAELARAKLDDLQDSKAEQLAQLESEFEELLKPADPDAELRPLTPEEEQALLEGKLTRVDEIARALEQEAREAIQNEDGDIAEARNQLAMAELLDQVTAAELSQSRNPDNPQAEAPNPLAEAMAELARARELMEQMGAADRREIPLSAREALLADLDELAASALDPLLLETLNDLEELRSAESQANELADTLGGLDEKETKARAEEIDSAVESLQQELAEALTQEGRDAFLNEAEEVVQDAQQSTEDLLTEARNLRAEMREQAQGQPPDDASKEAMQAQADALAEQAEDVGLDLARAEAVKDLLSEESAGEDAIPAFEKEVRPKLEEVAQKMSPDALDQAIEGIKDAAEELDQTSAEIAEARSPEPEQFAKTPDLPKANELDQFGQRLNGISDRLAEATAANNAAEEILEEKILPWEQKAMAAFASLPEESLSDQQQKERKQVETEMANDDLPWKPAEALDKAAAWAKESDPEQADAFKEAAKEARKMAEQTSAPAEFEKHAVNKGKEAINESKALDRELEKIGDNPLVEAAREDIEAMEKNIAAGEFERAGKNLEALRADLADLAASAAEAAAEEAAKLEPIDLNELAAQAAEMARENAATEAKPEPLSAAELAEQNPALKQAADPEQDLLTRKGLMEAAADKLEHPEAPLAGAELAVDENLDAAAELAQGDAALDFAEAAEMKNELAEGQGEPGSDTPEAFAEPRTALDPSAEAALEQQAAEDRAGLLAKAQKAAAEARADAKQLASELTKGEAPAEEKIDELAAQVNQAEAMRAALGEREFDAHRALADELEKALSTDELSEAQATEAAESAKALGEKLAAYEKDLQAEMEKQNRFDDIAEAAEELSAAAAEDAATAAAAKQAANNLAEQMKQVGLDEKALSKDAARAAEELAKADSRAEQEAAVAELAEALGDQTGNQKQLAEAGQTAKQAASELAKKDVGKEEVAETKAELAKAIEPLDQVPESVADAAAQLNKASKPQDVAKAAEKLAEAIEESAENNQSVAELAKAAAEAQAAASPEAAANENPDADGTPEAKAEQQLADLLEDGKGLASEQAAAAAEQLAKAESPAEAKAAAAELAAAVAALDPAPMPVAPNEEALDAAARAAALDNADALQDAVAGDYEAAKESMQALAEALPDGGQKNQAEQAAKEFAAAKEAQMEALPNKLAQALDQAESSEGELSEAAAESLNNAADAARAGEFARASEQLQEALADAPKQQKAALENLDQAIREAAKKEAQALANLPEATKDALAGVEQIETADPLAQAALAEAARALQQGDNVQATEALREAAFALPEQTSSMAAELAEQLSAAAEAADQAELSPTAQAAMDKLKKPDTAGDQQLAQAAAAQDFQQAAERAKQLGESNAAKAFEQAAKDQVEALPEFAKEGLKQLEQARNQAPRGSDQAEKLGDAERAARRGDFIEAAKLAQSAAQEQALALNAAEQLARADDVKDESITPLENALKSVQEGQFERAAMQAAQSPLGEKAADALEELRQSIDEAAQQAFEDAFTAERRARNPLQQAAQKLQRGNQLSQALSQAKRAGEEGKETVQAVEQAMKDVAAATKQLEQALRAAENDPAVKQAASSAQKAEQQARNDSNTARQDAQKMQQAEQAMQQAQNFLNQNKPGPALGALDRAKAPQELKDMVRALGDKPEGQAKNEANAAIEQAKSVAQQERGELQQAQQRATQASQQMQQARTAATRGQFDQAEQLARQGAQGAMEAKEAAQSFARAEQQQQQMAEARKEAAAQQAARQAAAQQAQQAQAQLAQAQAAQMAQAQPPSGQPQRSDPQSAQAQQNGEPSAQQSGEQSGQQSGEQSGQQSGEQSGQQSGEQSGQQSVQQSGQQSGQQPGQQPQPGAQEFAEAQAALPQAQVDALIDLETAQGELAEGQSATEAVAQAAESLGEAAEAMAQAALAQLADPAMQSGSPQNQSSQPSQSGQASQPSGQPQGQQAGQEQGQPGQPPSSSPEGFSPGGDQGNTSTQLAAAPSQLPAGPLGDSWKGVKDSLKTGDKKGRQQQYSDYYRKANRAYLEALNKKRGSR